MSTAFFQDGPQLANQFSDDRLLQSWMRTFLPAELTAQLSPGLTSLGQRVVDEMPALAAQAEAEPPRHVPYDAWGRRIDQLVMSSAWKRLHEVAAEEGIVATAYARNEGAYSRVHQLIRLYLYHPSSALYSCPLAMTDGAARAIELYGDAYLKAVPYAHLTSTDPQQFWTSGQWMTERTGGSDVSDTSTVARLIDGQWRLYGTKWFTSATTSEMAMTLARIEGAPAGSRGLSLFYLELRDEAQRLQNIEVHRLKDKLGTKALPTAELTLSGTPARLVGGDGHGVRKIASLFNITRVYNATCAVGFMRRGMALARDYAGRRRAFGRLLSEQPLHLETLAALELELQGAIHLTLYLGLLLGREETGQASASESALLRLLTPVCKLYTGRQGVAVISEVLETFGGAGYVEDTGLPRLLRDAQVLPIWEGTTNVLSLDTLRAIEKEQAFGPMLDDLQQRLSTLHTPVLRERVPQVLEAAHRLEAYLRRGLGDTPDFLITGARSLAYGIARTFTASLMLHHADRCVQEGRDPWAVHAALRWCDQPLAPVGSPDSAHRQASRALALLSPS